MKSVVKEAAGWGQGRGNGFWEISCSRPGFLRWCPPPLLWHGRFYLAVRLLSLQPCGSYAASYSKAEKDLVHCCWARPFKRVFLFLLPPQRQTERVFVRALRPFGGGGGGGGRIGGSSCRRRGLCKGLARDVYWTRWELGQDLIGFSVFQNVVTPRQLVVSTGRFYHFESLLRFSFNKPVPPWLVIPFELSLMSHRSLSLKSW